MNKSDGEEQRPASPYLGTKHAGRAPVGAVWTVQLLGPPVAQSGTLTAHLRSRKSWILFASLLLPEVLDGFAPERLARPEVFEREVLAERFWQDFECRRESLCTVLDDLRKCFGAGALSADRRTVQILPGRFVTDIARIAQLYAQARAAGAPDDRLRALSEASALIPGPIRGEFLQGCFAGDARLAEGYEEMAEAWYERQRRQVHGLLAQVLLELSWELEQAGNNNAAFESVLLSLHYRLESPQARNRARALGRRTGQADVVRALEGVKEFEQVHEKLAALREKGRAPTLGEQDRFAALIRERIGTLDEPNQALYMRLTFLPDPFPMEVAEEVCDVAAHLLRRLTRAGLVVTEPLPEPSAPVLYRIPEDIRMGIRHRLFDAKRVPDEEEHRLAEHLGRLGERWLRTQGDTRFVGFGGMARAEPFLARALDWTLQQPPTAERLDFLNLLRHYELPALALRALPYLEAASDGPQNPAELRVTAGLFAGRVRLSNIDFPGATRRLRAVLDLLEETGEGGLPNGTYWHGNVCRYLTLATHYGGDSRAALSVLAREIDCFSRIPHGDPMEVAGALRLRCEILNGLNEFGPALEAIDGALEIRRRLYALLGGLGHAATVADALFWKAAALRGLGDTDGDFSCLTEALGLWQKTGERTGIGHCLRELGRIRAGRGEIAEAREQLEHAVLIHRSASGPGCLTAALDTLGDVLFRQGEWEEAKVRYAECLRDSEARERSSAARFREKIAACERHLDAGPLA